MARLAPSSMHEARQYASRWLEWATEDYDTAACEQFIDDAARLFGEQRDFTYFAFDANNNFVLSCGLHNPVWSVPAFEIGYWCRTSMAGHGFATEATLGLSSFAFDQLGAARVEIRCDARNLRSCRVAEAAGFALEGVVRHCARGTRGELVSQRVYSRLAGSRDDAPGLVFA